MCVIEPVVVEDIPLEKRVLYVSCTGEHVHPAPPPPDKTIMKLRILQEVYEKTEIRGMAQLRHEVLRILERSKEGDGSCDRGGKFDGSIVSARRRLTSLLQRIPKLAVEVGELAVMAADPQIAYVRDSKMVNGNYVFFLGLDEGLMHASRAMAFGRDATYKTVTEKNRTVKEGRWYLYNIVTAGSIDRLSDKSIVVMRALMTGLSKATYYAVWKYFFESLIMARNLVRGAEVLEHGSIEVPYIDIPDILKARACFVSMDFDSAEIHGCAEALKTVCGGTLDMHLGHMFVGCAVHLQRDLSRHAKDAEKQRKTGKTEKELYAIYTAYADAVNPEEAKEALQKIKSFDCGWTRLVESQLDGMGPLICRKLCRMTPTHRSLAFSHTNFVESQNRRGNLYVGTHNRPGEVALKLYDLDRVDQISLRRREYNQISRSRGRRNRSGFILRPSGVSAASTTKRRNKSGGGPAPKKIRAKGSVPRKQSTTSSPRRNGGSAKESMQSLARGSDVHMTEKGNFELLERMLQMISSLESRPESLGRGKVDELETDDMLLNRRMDALITLLAAIDGTKGESESVRKVLIGCMQHHQKDVAFRKELFKIFSACVCSRPSQSSQPSKDGAEQTCNKVPVASTGGIQQTPWNQGIVTEDCGAFNCFYLMVTNLRLSRRNRKSFFTTLRLRSSTRSSATEGVRELTYCGVYKCLVCGITR